jgi:hypothetical protein
MTTERQRRRRPAHRARRLVGGVSLAAVLGLVAGWSATADPPAAPQPAPAGVRVVITDPAIDRDVAVAAALDAAARGVDRVTVPVAGSVSATRSQVSNAPHTTTRAS